MAKKTSKVSVVGQLNAKIKELETTVADQRAMIDNDTKMMAEATTTINDQARALRMSRETVTRLSDVNEDLRAGSVQDLAIRRGKDATIKELQAEIMELNRQVINRMENLHVTKALLDVAAPSCGCRR